MRRQQQTGNLSLCTLITNERNASDVHGRCALTPAACACMRNRRRRWLLLAIHASSVVDIPINQEQQK